MNKVELMIRSFLTFMFMMVVIVFSKIKLHPIFGTGTSFSLLVMFAPIIIYFTGTFFGVIAIYGARIIQILIGISKAQTYFSFILYTPLFLAGFYFSKMFRKTRYEVLVPIIAIALFLIHPIGRTVWYYSLFWIIPIIISLNKKRLLRLTRKRDIPTIYLYSIASTFIDHAVGSIMYLYYLNIPAIYWIMAIPFIPFERMIYALGITISYLFVRNAIRAFQRVVRIELRIEDKVVSRGKVTSPQIPLWESFS